MNLLTLIRLVSSFIIRKMELQMFKGIFHFNEILKLLCGTFPLLKVIKTITLLCFCSVLQLLHSSGFDKCFWRTWRAEQKASKQCSPVTCFICTKAASGFCKKRDRRHCIVPFFFSEENHTTSRVKKSNLSCPASCFCS